MLTSDDRFELPQYIKDEMTVMVRGCYESMEDIQETLVQSIEDELDEDLDDDLVAELTTALMKEAKQLRDALAKEAEGWTKPTRNDALDSAFEELNSRGIVALQNAGYTQSDGWSDVNDTAAELADEGQSPRGGAFFHGQDLERAVNGEGLYITFGAYADDAATADAKSIEVGNEIAEVLKSHGFAVEWDGTIKTRVHTGPFVWQRRPQ